MDIVIISPVVKVTAVNKNFHVLEAEQAYDLEMAERQRCDTSSSDWSSPDVIVVKDADTDKQKLDAPGPLDDVKVKFGVHLPSKLCAMAINTIMEADKNTRRSSPYYRSPRHWDKIDEPSTSKDWT